LLASVHEAERDSAGSIASGDDACCLRFWLPMLHDGKAGADRPGDRHAQRLGALQPTFSVQPWIVSLREIRDWHTFAFNYAAPQIEA
jgi:hypothetical protein